MKAPIINGQSLRDLLSGLQLSIEWFVRLSRTVNQVKPLLLIQISYLELKLIKFRYSFLRSCSLFFVKSRHQSSDPVSCVLVFSNLFWFLGLLTFSYLKNNKWIKLI